jgi:hypothetical protein
MPTVNGPRHRTSTPRQPRATNRQRETGGQREVHKQRESGRTTGARQRTVEPERNSAMMDAAEGFALGALTGWHLPWLKSKLVLGDRMTELLSPALLLAQAGSAVSLGAICSAARLVKRHTGD